MARPRSCWKCATNQSHPFRHWHAWCRFCRRPRIYRGPACGRCRRKFRTLVQQILKEV